MFKGYLAILIYCLVFYTSRGEASPSYINPCKKIMTNLAPHYQKLWQSIKKQTKPPKSEIFSLVESNLEDCSNPQKAAKIYQAVSRYTRNIALIIPDSSRNSFAQVVLETMKNFFSKKKNSNTKKIVVLPTKTTSLSVTQRIAEAVFIHQVGVLVGGESYNEAWVLFNWAEKLKIPALILYPSVADKLKVNHSFFISPSPQQLAKGFDKLLNIRNAKKVAILSPANKHDHIIQKLIANKQVDFDSFVYNSNDFNSMKVTISELLKIHDNQRREELELLVAAEIENAKEEKRQAYPENIILPARLDYDAIIIADHFKNVRHLVGLFKFFNSPKPLLIGTQQWRAPELISPPEEFLEGAYFIDYLGNLNQLPFGMRVATDETGLYGEQTSDLDIRLIANFAASICEAIFANPLTPRFQIYKKIENLKHLENEDFFKSKQIFNPDHESNWPTFTFKVVNQNIQIRYESNY